MTPALSNIVNFIENRLRILKDNVGKPYEYLNIGRNGHQIIFMDKDYVDHVVGTFNTEGNEIFFHFNSNSSPEEQRSNVNKAALVLGSLVAMDEVGGKLTIHIGNTNIGTLDSDKLNALPGFREGFRRTHF